MTLRARAPRLAVALAAAALLAGVLAVAAPPAAAMPPGWVDTGFGTAGLVTITDPAPAGVGRMTVDGSSRSLLLTTGSSPAVTRLSADGPVDSAFGSSGRASLSIANGAAWLHLAAAADGTSLAVGSTSSGLVVQKLLATGQPDTGFGNAGLAAVPVAGPPTAASAGSGAAAAADGGVFIWWQRAGTPVDSVVVKLTPTGSPDAAFGAAGPTPGVVTLTGTAVTGATVDGTALALAVLTSPGAEAQLRRLGADGLPDPTFNTGTPGTVTLPSAVGTPGGVTPAPGGGYVVGGFAAVLPTVGHLTAAKVNPDGTRDTTFGSSGATVAQSWTCPGATVPLAGSTAIHLVGMCTQGAAEVVRLSAAGAPDAGFAAGGHLALSDLGDLFVDRPIGAGLTSTGQPLVGTRGTLSLPPAVLGVVRLRGSSTVVPGGYVPVSPRRVLDTRANAGSPVPANGSVTVAVDTGNPGSGIPTGQAASVVLNITVTGSTAPGNIVAFPNGATAPTSSNVNFLTGQTIANQATVRVGTAGAVVLRNNSTGTAHLVVDVLGYYRAGTATAPGTFAGLTPRRILDTRSGVGAPLAAVPANGVVNLTVAGFGGVPATGAGAVVLNVTATRPTAPGFVTVYPFGTTLPNASNVNFAAGQTIPNQVTVRLGSNGRVTLANRSKGTVHLVADVMGYYRSGTASAPGSFVPINPARLLDTRQGTGGPIARGGARFASTTATGAIPGTGVAAAAFNVTATGSNATGVLAVVPGDQLVFETSNLNFATGQTIANQVVSGTGYLGIWVSNASGGAGTTVHVVVDVAGYFRS